MLGWNRYKEQKEKPLLLGASLLLMVIAFMIYGFVIDLTRPDLIKGNFKLDVKSQLISDEIIQISNKSKRVYYTLDCSEPNLNKLYFDKPTSNIELSFLNVFREFVSSKPTSPMWKNPLGLDERGLVLNYRIKNTDNTLTPTQTKVFIPDPCLGKEHRIPVISLSTDFDNLFHHHKGMFIMGREYYRTMEFEDERLAQPSWYKYWELPANYHNRGPEWLREGFLSYFNDSGALQFERNVNFKLKGSASRALPQKSIVIDFKNELMEEPLFNQGGSSERYWKFLLRNSGGDFIHTMLRDAFFQSLLSDTRLLTQAYKPVVIFINGEYWGIQNLRQHFDELELGNRLGKPGHRIEIIELSEAARKKQIIPNSWDLFYDELMQIEEDSLYYSMFQQSVDLEPFVDYMILQCYSANTDWPNNNVRVYSQPDSSAKWLFLLYDTDYGFGGAEIPQSYQINMHQNILENNSVIAEMYRRLVKVPAFNKYYLGRYNFLLRNALDEERMLKNWNSSCSIIKPYMTQHIKRWRMPKDMNAWHLATDVVSEFISKRKEFCLIEMDQIKRELDK